MSRSVSVPGINGWYLAWFGATGSREHINVEGLQVSLVSLYLEQLYNI